MGDTEGCLKCSAVEVGMRHELHNFKEKLPGSAEEMTRLVTCLLLKCEDWNLDY